MTQERQEQRTRRVIGLDAHPYLFSAAALSGCDALQAETEWIVDRLPLTQLEAIIRKRVAPEDVVVLEASGNSFSVAERIAKCGRVAIVLESQSVGRVGKTYCATDKVDAVKIARVYLSGLAHVVWAPDEKAASRRELFFAYRNSVKDAVRARNRVWAWFNSNGIKQPRNFKLSEKSALDRFLQIKDWTPIQKVIIEDMLTTFWQAEERRKTFNAIIAEQVLANEDVFKLMRLLGVKHLVAFALAAFIGPIDRFATPRKLVAYFGLNPNVQRSGIHGKNGHLAHYGRSDVRALLVQAAQSILRYGQGHVHKWALALKMRKGATVAIAALARKLVVSIWYLMRGLFSPLAEIPKTLATKIHKVISLIDRKRIKQLGYASVAQFKQTKEREFLLPC